MISYIRGELVALEEDKAIVDVGGVGYGIFMSGQAMGQLPPVGSKVKIHTYLNVKEDAMQLYGFLNRDALSVFKLLIGVSGIGPKGGLGILAQLTPDELRFAVMSKDIKAISAAPGIGKKTAEKLIVELGANEIPRIDVFNKCDRVEAGDLRPHGADICSISARTGEGVDRLLEMIDRRLDKGTRRVTIHLPYDKGGLLDMLYREAKVESVEYSETIDIVAVCPPKVLGQIGDYTSDWTPPKEDWE